MKSCPACRDRLGAITLLLGVKYHRFACPHCGAILERNFDRSLWIVLVGTAAALALGGALFLMDAGWGALKGLVVGPLVAVTLAKLCCPLEIAEPAVLRPGGSTPG
jgi:hypothetical protein